MVNSESANSESEDPSVTQWAASQIEHFRAMNERNQARVNGLCLTPKMKEYLGRDVTVQEFEELMAGVRICRATPENVKFHKSIAAMVEKRFQISEESFLKLIQEKDDDLEYIDPNAVGGEASRSRVLRKE